MEINAQASDLFLIAGDDADAQLVALPAGSALMSGQANFDQFTDAMAATKRALEIGVKRGATYPFWPEGKTYNPVPPGSWVDNPDRPPEWAADGSYPLHAVVIHNGKRWLHISDAQGEPDDFYDIDAGTGDWIPLD